MCKKLKPQNVQPIEQSQCRPRKLIISMRIQTFLSTHYQEALCVRTQKFTFNQHQICLYCYKNLDVDFANIHALTVIHFICVYSRPPIEFCEICNYELTKYQKINRCRRCVYKYKNFICSQSYNELTEFYTFPAFGDSIQKNML
jgi:hypothetical protein